MVGFSHYEQGTAQNESRGSKSPHNGFTDAESYKPSCPLSHYLFVLCWFLGASIGWEDIQEEERSGVCAVGCYSHKQIPLDWLSEKYLNIWNPVPLSQIFKEKHWSPPGSPLSHTLVCDNSSILSFQACRTRKARSSPDVCGWAELIAEFCELHFTGKRTDDSRGTTGRLRWLVWEGGREGRRGIEASDAFTFKISLPEQKQLISTYLEHI